MENRRVFGSCSTQYIIAISNGFISAVPRLANSNQVPLAIVITIELSMQYDAQIKNHYLQPGAVYEVNKKRQLGSPELTRIS